MNYCCPFTVVFRSHLKETSPDYNVCNVKYKNLKFHITNVVIICNVKFQVFVFSVDVNILADYRVCVFVSDLPGPDGERQRPSIKNHRTAGGHSGHPCGEHGQS